MSSSCFFTGMQERRSDPASRNLSIQRLASSKSFARSTKAFPRTVAPSGGTPNRERLPSSGTGEKRSSTYRIPSLPTSSSTLPSATFLPLSSMMTRSQNASTSEMMWELKKTVLPEGGPSGSLQPHPEKHPSGPLGDLRAGKPVQVPAKPQELLSRQVFIEVGLLGHEPDPASQFGPASGFLSDARDRAGIGKGKPGQDLDGCRLPGAVGAQEPDNFVSRHREGEVGEHPRTPSPEARRVRLRQPLDLDQAIPVHHDFRNTFRRSRARLLWI